MVEQKVAIVTGASQGIGRAIALKFADEGISVVLAARNEAGLQETAEFIRSRNGASTLIVKTDLRDPQQIENLVDTTLGEWGRIDILVNNAGILIMKPILELTFDEYREMMRVNMDAVFLLTKAVLPTMFSREEGTVINIASLAGKNAVKFGTGYATTKWALRGFAASLMLEVREKNIRVVTVFPGSVNTPMLGASATAPSAETRLQPEDVAHAVYAALSVHPRAMISEIDIRPSNPKKP